MSTKEQSIFSLSPIGQAIWRDRYALKDMEGHPIEKNISENFRRVANAVAQSESQPEVLADQFFDLMNSGEFCPAGRILANAGTSFSQLLNCYVLPFEDDSLESIMKTARNIAVTQKHGGGVGINYSNLRPEGSHIKGVNGRSCGTIGFIDMLSVVSGVIEQGGCLTYDTLVNTTKGLLYLGELIGDGHKDQGWYDQDLTVKTKDGDKKSCRHYVNGYTDVVRIETDCGVTLKGTPSHKLFVMTESGPLWREFKDIHVGDWVISGLGQHSGTIQSLDNNVIKGHHNCIVPDRLPDVIDNEFAHFLGYYVGNGFAAANEHDHRIGVTIPDKSHLNGRIEGVFRKLFGENVRVTFIKKDNDKSTTYYISNRMVKEFFGINGLLKKKSLETTIPQKIRQSPPDVVASFLSGLFEADGSTHFGYPLLSTCSEVLAKEVQTLLFGLGIPCKLKSKEPGLGSFSDSPRYTVTVVSPKGLEVWNKKIPVDLESRFMACHTCEPDDKNQRWYVLPFGGYWLKSAFDSIPKHKQGSGFGSLRKEMLRLVKGERRLTLSAFERIRSRLADHKTGILDEGVVLEPSKMIDYPEVGNRFFLEVTDTSWEEDYTADLEVEESHSYFANTLVSHNSRRGANLGLLEVGHPDIWEFVEYKNKNEWNRLLEFMTVHDQERWEYFKKANPYKLQMYNISVGITDEFLKALKDDDEWSFHWKDEEWLLYEVIYTRDEGDGKFSNKRFEITANNMDTAIWKVKRLIPHPKSSDDFSCESRRKPKASEVWERICFNAWSNGCPGLINISTIREMHNGEQIDRFCCVNPCGEQPLPSYGACNLGALVLPRFVDEEGNIDYDGMKKAVHLSVRFLDNVTDMCDFPIAEQEEVAKSERRVGLGTMGIHDLLIKMKLAYDSDEGRLVTENILKFIRDEAYTASIELAKEKGPFSKFDSDKYLQGGFVNTLSSKLRGQIESYGIRNMCILSQAPTGTIGAMLGVSQGCEPWFSLSFERYTGLGTFTDGCEEYIQWRAEHPDDDCPPYFKTAMDISPEDHLKMMIVFNRYSDSSVSKTINLPNSATVEDVSRIFKSALENRVKGITIFRDGCREGVLKATVANKTDTVSIDNGVEQEHMSHFKKRGSRVTGATTRVHMDNRNLYVTVNKDTVGDMVELFATVGESKNPNTQRTSGVEDSWAEALGKVVSLALRAGVNPEAIIRNLKNIPSDKPLFQTIGDSIVSELIPSPPHAIARVMEEELHYIQNDIKIEREKTGGFCTSCGSENIRWKTSTCYDCIDCSYSGCG